MKDVTWQHKVLKTCYVKQTALYMPTAAATANTFCIHCMLTVFRRERERERGRILHS